MEPLRELCDLTVRHAGPGLMASGHHEILGLRFIVARQTPEPMHHVYEPVVSLVLDSSTTHATSPFWAPSPSERSCGVSSAASRGSGSARSGWRTVVSRRSVVRCGGCVTTTVEGCGSRGWRG
jgi:hypothetical protein